MDGFTAMLRSRVVRLLAGWKNFGTDTFAAAAISSTTNLSHPMQVDYVRVWK